MSSYEIKPILTELLNIELQVNNNVYVWQNYMYHLVPSPTPDTRLIIETDVTTNTITRQIAINNIIQIDTSVYKTHNKYYPYYIFRTTNHIILIERTSIFPFIVFDRSSYTINIYIQNINADQHPVQLPIQLPIQLPMQLPIQLPIQLEAIKRIFDIIEHNNKLYICIENTLIQEYPHIIINNKSVMTYTNILIIDMTTCTIEKTIPALNNLVSSINIIDDKLIVCHRSNSVHALKLIWDINNLSSEPRIVDQSFVDYTVHNNLIYSFDGFRENNPPFIESNLYQMVDTLHTPMTNLIHVNIIDDNYYIGINMYIKYRLATGELNEYQDIIYNLRTHNMVSCNPFNILYQDIGDKFRPFYIYNNYIIVNTQNNVKIYRLEYKNVYERQNLYDMHITNLCKKYELQNNVKTEINKYFGNELLLYKTFEIIANDF